MGYANIAQKGTGIHLRQFSRAFVFDDGTSRNVFVSVDAGMIGQALRRDIIANLQKRFGDLYNDQNVLISGTHTHGAPGGYLMDLIFDITTLGFVRETYEAMTQGITQSIIRAHNNLVPGRIFVSQGELLEANINRSPAAYLNNPEEERAQYLHNVDKTMTQMRFEDTSGRGLGVISWFAVHPTSMNNTNTLVSSDNMGYASIILETKMNPGALPGQGQFVAAFASSNLGDVSPNIKGPKCSKSGEECDILTSTCPKGAGDCIARGPGENGDMFQSTKIIAERLAGRAESLLTEAKGREVHGPIKSIYQYIDMPNANGTYFNPKTKEVEQVRGCLPAMGYSFAAGTTDGPGAFDFQQGDVTGNPFWNAIRNFLAVPTAEDIECQKPKPILLATGRAHLPYQWQPTIVPTQLLMIGDVALVAIPGEFTTMAGRRMRDAVRVALKEAGGPEALVVIAGLSNTYTDYVVTPEEYQVQRYEAASTIYGPHTHTLYIQQYQKLARALAKNETLELGPKPNYFDDKVWTLVPGVVYDSAEMGKDFGDCKRQPKETYNRGETASAVFVSGNPRNDRLHGKTFLKVERQVENGGWETVYTDAHWDTKMHWRRINLITGTSDVTVEWTISDDVTPGTYRIKHFGNFKFLLGGIFPYEGTSNAFQVL
ncbi:neutral ceramidase [Ctenocephalides felis]|uniref:neutral ceramidase n=3 Tax=Ctenocephalides felis TaxID=7515 RepID=UPI000E6E3FDC|nr:neutral ceramidase [Ctenocephalides felis]